MNNKYYLNILILLVSCLFINTQANAALINSSYEFNGNVKFTWTGYWCVVPKNSWDNKHYKFKIKEKGKLSWDITIYVDAADSNAIIAQDYFEDGKEYVVKVKYHGRKKDCGRNQAIIVRTLDEINFIYNYEVQIPATAVKIRNTSFAKCIYPYNPGTGVRFHNWGCWNDPSFAFIIQPTGTFNEVKLQSLAAGGQCLMPVDDSSYGEITTGSCSSVYAVYQIQDVGGSQFRLRNKIRNKCLYGSPLNGGLIRDFGCWANPDMNFTFENY